MKFSTLFFSIIGKDDENLLSAAVVIDALRVTTLPFIKALFAKVLVYGFLEYKG